ncbi:1-phosphofructokinase [Pseudogulbenkiania sp. MAI-1]|uniref:1-phosphofructokinase n=1 Tax=Pseudogulbenkiania sp. MAI-1 TaxID=990370 RepID=UPI00045E8F23|nr:1-phosphofructokinase [Pseudogulbenkiania sp. MAI-1]
MTRPIVTVTLNPAIDQTVMLDRLNPGAVNVARSSQINAGGKGVNVASCLADWEIPVIATGILGRDNATPFEQLFADKGINDRFVRHDGATRVNIKLVDGSDNSTTDVNLPGHPVDAATFEALLQQLDDLAEPGRCFVLAGSLPAGLAEDSYAVLIGRLRQHGAHVVLDSSGAALATALADGVATLPACIKPNRHELEQLVGRELATLDAVGDEVARLRARGIAEVVVSLGEEGALFAGAEGIWLARPPKVALTSTVGAGDALVAGLIAARYGGRSAPDTARLAVAFAAGKLAQVGPHLPAVDEVEALAARVDLAQLGA